MKSVSILLGIVVIILTMTLLLGAQDPRFQWEYANFYFEAGTVWRYDSPDEEAQAGTIFELCKKLNISASCRETGISGVLDYAGSRGWELILWDERPTKSNFWFKRPK